MNSLVIEKSGEVSRVTACLNHPPLKFINPRPAAGACQVYVSNYGGGLLGGDTVSMQVECLPGSRLFLGTQASTKIYRSADGRPSVQETVGMLHAGALAVVGPDPVVPFAGSRYRQIQSWQLHPEADLVLLDWMQSGREARGEVFAFHGYENELRILGPGGRPLLIERFGADPAEGRSEAVGQFGPFRSWLSLYLAGPRASALGDALVPGLLALGRASGEGAPRLWVAAGRRDALGWVIRAMGRDRRDVQPVQDALFGALAGPGPGGTPGLLGFNPWTRRW